MQGIRLILQSSRSWRSSVVEQLTCNQQVGGSTPFASSAENRGVWCWVIGESPSPKTESPTLDGEVAEWTKAADCKSAGVRLRRFESCPPHHDCGFWISGFGFRNYSAIGNCRPTIEFAGVAQLARASAFQAEGRGFESRLPLSCCQAHVAQAVEHILGKDVVGGSSPPVGSKMVDCFRCDN